MAIPRWFWAIDFAAAAQNPIPDLIPFRGVIRSPGAFGAYVGEAARIDPPALHLRAVGRLHVTRPTSNSRDEMPSHTKHNQQ